MINWPKPEIMQQIYVGLGLFCFGTAYGQMVPLSITGRIITGIVCIIVAWIWPPIFNYAHPKKDKNREENDDN